MCCLCLFLVLLDRCSEKWQESGGRVKETLSPPRSPKTDPIANMLLKVRESINSKIIAGQNNKQKKLFQKSATCMKQNQTQTLFLTPNFNKQEKLYEKWSPFLLQCLFTHGQEYLQHCIQNLMVLIRCTQNWVFGCWGQVCSCCQLLPGEQLLETGFLKLPVGSGHQSAAARSTPAQDSSPIRRRPCRDT